MKTKRMKLSKCDNILYVIAEAWLRYHKEYRCLIDGQRVIVTK